MHAAVLPQNVPDFLLKLLQGHGFAGEIGNEIAGRPRSGAEAELAQQVE
jgi:hypothetical protein